MNFSRSMRSLRADSFRGSLWGLALAVVLLAADKALWLDLRCLEESDEAEFAAQWSALRP